MPLINNLVKLPDIISPAHWANEDVVKICFMPTKFIFPNLKDKWLTMN
ncbi:hypothetical protein C900_05205 [Fulvivirga imtechensis AK7]|uniref:Uncharacterized protein n=1 Tax=Fulvivirga imtechensis AK7 TaxID=1237149 RepID=L8JVT1_9BACT|nr:hypothetical protein C900_05205 [Fulvivirga imtechensis AK7]